MEDINTKNIIRYFIFITLLSFPTFGFNQSLVTYHHLGLNDGLTDLTVNAIVQDSLGILYFGTENGLTVFNGADFEQYFSGTGTSTISDNSIYALLLDMSGKVWIGNSKGIDKYDRKNETFKHYKVSGADFSIYSIFQDINKRIWIGSYGAGLFYYDELLDSMIAFKSHLLQSVSISCITEDARGNLWLGTEVNGLFFIDRNTMEVFSFKEGIIGISAPYDFSNIRIRVLYADRLGDMLIGTYDKGLYRYSISDKEIIKFDPVPSDLMADAHITGILKDKLENIWISADGGGIFLYRRKYKDIIDLSGVAQVSNSLISKSIRTIFIDSDQTLWLGAYKSGLYYTYELQKDNFDFFYQAFNTPNITAIEGIDSNRLLIGTDGSGLYTFEPAHNKAKQIILDKSVAADNVLCIDKDNLGKYWIGSFLNGAVVLNRLLQPVNHFSYKSNSLNYSDVRSVVQNNANVYFATNGGGLNIYDFASKSFSYCMVDIASPDSGIIFNQLGSLFIDSKDFLWMGSRDGMTRMNILTGRFVNISSTDSTGGHSFVHCFYEDNRGFVWFGSNMGLSKLIKPLTSPGISSEVNAYTKSNYIFKNYSHTNKGGVIVYSILEDNQGNLWLGTNKGLARFNIKKEQIQFFYPESGTNMSLFNPNSAYKSKKGKLYFGGNKGLVGFFPDSIREFSLSPKLIVSQFLINMKSYKCGDLYKGKPLLNKHINYTKDLTIRHGARIITIQFGSTNTFLPDEIEYAYKLDKFDNNWNFLSGKNLMATYTNLSPGTYTFKLKARYNIENWNDAIRELKITILPPFWKTDWFKILLVFLIMALVFLGYRLRVANLRYKNIKLEELVFIKSKELLVANEAKLEQLENNKRLMLEKQQIENERLRIEKEMERATNERLSTELELKVQIENGIKAELSASLAQISKKNDLLQMLKNELKALLTYKDDNLKENLANIIAKIDSENYFRDDWQKFEKHFNSVYADFMNKIIIRYPGLTQKELRLCTYLKMNLSSNEIAQLSNITLRGVEKSRNRLRKKLELDPKDDLNHFIINFE